MSTYWMETYKGKKVHPDIAISTIDIDIEDIARSLSMQCRFVGHIELWYCVADHSIRVAELVPKEIRLEALLHDAAEAYIGDLSRPLKKSLRDISDQLETLEATIQYVIYQAFGIDEADAISAVWHKGRYRPIQHADNVMVLTEGRDVKSSTIIDQWGFKESPLASRIEPRTQKEAEQDFLKAYQLYVR